jgi:Amt family ammonium transporter
VSPVSALLIGSMAGLACYWGSTALKRLLRADDSLDVFGVHGIGGIVGCLMTGLLASKSISGAEGHLWVQALSAGSVLLYSGTMTAVLLLVTRFIVGLRVDEQTEQSGVDIAQHRERLA